MVSRVIEGTLKQMQKEQFSEERMVKILEENINKDNKEVLKIMAQKLEEFKMEYRDDVSMILLEIP